MKLRSLALPALVSVALFLGACHSDSKAQPKTAPATTKATTGSMGVVNSKCPMKGEPIEKGDPTMDYKGQKVAFCCTGCMGKFAKLSDADKDAKLAAAK
jgi:hypothetical protein